RSTLEVKGGVETTGVAAGDMGLRARLNASGGVALRSRTVDLAFDLKLDGTRPVAGSLPRLRSVDLVATGRARGAWPPPVDATIGGSPHAETPKGAEAV